MALNKEEEAKAYEAYLKKHAKGRTLLFGLKLLRLDKQEAEEKRAALKAKQAELQAIKEHEKLKAWTKAIEASEPHRRARDEVAAKKRLSALKSRLKKYGLTMEQYEAMAASQQGICAICNKPPKRILFIDHCHTRGKVRGLLCSSCNTALGLFFDDVDSLERAKEYLQKPLDGMPDIRCTRYDKPGNGYKDPI